VVAALVQLGWNEAAATRAVASAEAAHRDEAGRDAVLAVPELLRASLRRLGGGRRV
ncbi:MAG: Holliday junction branch migration protein RuvA, partial [Actinomyces dentalis]